MHERLSAGSIEETLLFPQTLKLWLSETWLLIPKFQETLFMESDAENSRGPVTPPDPEQDTS